MIIIIIITSITDYCSHSFPRWRAPGFAADNPTSSFYSCRRELGIMMATSVLTAVRCYQRAAINRSIYRRAETGVRL